MINRFNKLLQQQHGQAFNLSNRIITMPNAIVHSEVVYIPHCAIMSRCHYSIQPLPQPRVCQQLMVNYPW